MCVCVCVCVCVRARARASFALSCVTVAVRCEEYIVVELSRQFLLTICKAGSVCSASSAGDRDTAVAE